MEERKKLRNELSDVIDILMVEAIKKHQLIENSSFGFLNMPKHDNYPTFSIYEDSFPSFDKYPKNYENKINYADILTKDKNDEQIVALSNLLKSYNNYKRLSSYYEINDWSPPDPEIKEQIKIDLFKNRLLKLVDYVLHQPKSNRNTVKKKTIELWLNSIYHDNLDYEIVVPIIYHNSEFDSFKISSKIRIEKISSEIQLSRNIEVPKNLTVNTDVIGAANYALVLSDFVKTVNNSNYYEHENKLEKKIDDALVAVEDVFSILNLVKDNSVGYCQVIADPINHQYDWFGEIIKRKIFGIKRYPQEYDAKKHQEKHLFTKSDLYQIKKLYSKSINLKQIKLAKRKLLDSELRDSIDDKTLDLATAFESLLSDTKDTIKYKIALRSAAICKMQRHPNFDVIQVRDIVKKFYDFRSDIIHGSQNSYAKNKTITIPTYPTMNTYTIARVLLKHIIKFFIEYPDYLDVQKIDEYLLTGKKYEH